MGQSMSRKENDRVDVIRRVLRAAGGSHWPDRRPRAGADRGNDLVNGLAGDECRHPERFVVTNWKRWWTVASGRRSAAP